MSHSQFNIKAKTPIRPEASVIQIMHHHFHISDGNEVAHNMARLLLLAQISILEASAVL
jgi:hypothetical protein